LGTGLSKPLFIPADRGIRKNEKKKQAGKAVPSFQIPSRVTLEAARNFSVLQNCCKKDEKRGHEDERVDT